MEYKFIKIPQNGEKITIDEKGNLNVPNNPIIPFIEGDGTGADIWKTTKKVVDKAVETAYNSKRKIEWTEVYAGEKSFNMFNTWLLDETVDAFNEFLVGIKGPLTTPVGGGIRSLNVALRQKLDLYVCLRPVKYFKGVPSPVKKPHLVDMVIFRENTEDIYSGIEWNSGSEEAKKVIKFIQNEMKVNKIRFPETSSIGIKNISKEGSERLMDSAIKYAIKYNRKSITIVHKGNIMKFTEGGFREWNYNYAVENFRNEVITQKESYILQNIEDNPNITIEENCKMIEPGYDYMTQQQKLNIQKDVETTLKLVETHGNGKWKNKLMIRDSIADITLQQVLTRPSEFDIIITTNLNGDYISDALAAQVGGIGIAPGGNINYKSGHAIFEATHGTAPKYANLDKVNPGSLILSSVLMLQYMGWDEAADLILKGLESSILNKKVTYDFARLMKEEGLSDVKEIKCSQFGDEIISNMN